MPHNLGSQPAGPLGLFNAGLIKITKPVNAKFEFRHESLKSNFTFAIPSVYMIVPLKNSAKESAFEQKKKKSDLKFYPRASVNRPSNTWALVK